MISSTLLVILSICLVAGNDDKETVECREESGWTKDRAVKEFEKIGKKNVLQQYDFLPKDYFCFAKCIAMKHGFIKKDMIDIEQYRKGKNLKEGFLECIDKIGPITECEGFREVLKCENIYTKTVTDIYKDCMEENHWSIRKSLAFERKFPKLNLSKIEETNLIPKEKLCTQKCVHERLGNYINGKINMNNVSLHTRMFERTEDYIKCMADLEIKQCEDVRKHLWCNANFFNPAIFNCAKNFNLTVVLKQRRSRRNSDDLQKKLLCYEKCLMEKNQLLDGNGIIQWDRAKYYKKISNGIKNETALYECLKELKILECEDYDKIIDCREQVLESQ